MEYLIHSAVALLGLSIGSFLNVVIYRVPRNLPFVMGRSSCPKCRQDIRWYDNIPLLSFVLLRGSCRRCGESISVRYPAVEGLNALVYVYLLWQFELGLSFLVYAVVGSALLVAVFIDLEHRIIPDSITLPGIVLGLVYSFAPDSIGIVPAILGTLAGGGSLLLVAILGEKMFGKESLGGGDIKMAAMLGAFLGWKKILLVFIGSAAIGLVASLALMAFSARLRQERAVPFGPFIALAAVVAMLWGEAIIRWYLTTFVFAA